ncbi:MAG: hypothetical protein AB8B53_15375 [Flavobacteriales bacterium]
MAEFLKGNRVLAALEEIISKAEKELIIVSPYISFHTRFEDVLKEKVANDKLKVTVVFGKRDTDLLSNFDSADLAFLKGLPNVELRHEPRLHSKYYANEHHSLLSTINLYDFSQNEQIEFGVHVNKGGILSGNLMPSALDKDSTEYFDSVVTNSQVVYKSTPVYEDKMLGLSKKYSHSEVEVDELV